MDIVRIGFVPAHRGSLSEDWASQLRQRCLDVFRKIPGLEIIVPDEKLTERGFVRNEAEAEKVIKLFQAKGIDGLIIGTMTFGDEISINTIAAAFRNKPQLLFGTKEAEVPSCGARTSDSFCGTLSISSGLHRRKIPFIFAGLVYPEEKEFQQYISDFVGTCSVVKGFIGAKIGLVGPRPEPFETCIYNEDAMIKQFNQRVVPTGVSDLLLRSSGLKKGDPALVKNCERNGCRNRHDKLRRRNRRKTGTCRICSKELRCRERPLRHGYTVLFGDGNAFRCRPLLCHGQNNHRRHYGFL